MSDGRLRELERRWRDTGAADDGAAYLQERVRVGDLLPERLELAAYAGHVPAQRLLGAARPLSIDPAWPDGLPTWGREVVVRAAVAAARAAQVRLDDDLPENREIVDRLLRAAESALLTPTTLRRSKLEQLWKEETGDAVRRVLRRPQATSRAREAASRADHAATMAVGATGARTLRDAVTRTRHAIGASRLAIGPEAVMAAIASELGGWALGEHDPVRERSGLTGSSA